MLDKFYKKHLEPVSKDRGVRAREFVLNVLLAGSLFLVAFAILINIFVSLLVLHHTRVLSYLPTMFGLLFFFFTLYVLARKGLYRYSAAILVGVYSLIALDLVAQWGILIPQGILLLALVVVLSGILLGSKYAIWSSAAATALLAVLLVLQVRHMVNPDISWGKDHGELADVIVFGATFMIIGVVSALYNWQMEGSLRRARTSERALKRQKELLEATVEKRTKELQAAQAQKMKQFYHFAELGHVSTALLHDLSNHLSMLMLDIESLGQANSNRTAIIKQSHSSVEYIEQLVQRVRYQLQGDAIIQPFNLADEISEAMQLIAYKASRAHVTLELVTEQKRDSFGYDGDFVGFRQLVSNVLSNSVEAYETVSDARGKKGDRHVSVALKRTADNFVITVTDWGRGIKTSELNKIFDAFYTTRKQGMGIGLFISRQLVEDQFKGRLTVASKPGVGTIFTVELPRRQK